jgi:hypothetical protein
MGTGSDVLMARVPSSDSLATPAFDRWEGGDLVTPDNFVLENLPDDVVASIEARDAFIASLPPAAGGEEFVVSDLQRWRPGRTVRVAFLGGDTALHRDIEDATRQITDACNLILDFGLDPATGAYRTWSLADETYSAEIRVSFDQGGFFSLVGTDCIDPDVGHPLGSVGGRPGQRTLNLGGFPVRRPDNWRGVVRHEFLHALAFMHAHQNLRGTCEAEFRWEDDADYVPTKDERGQFIPDDQGRRPGIYTFLSGKPNEWNRAKVDHNLRRLDGPAVITGPFDSASVMLYRFPDLFYQSLPSSCAPTGDGISLSVGDVRALDLMYPVIGPATDDIDRRNDALIEAIQPRAQPLPGLESDETLLAQRVSAMLHRR